MNILFLLSSESLLSYIGKYVENSILTEEQRQKVRKEARNMKPTRYYSNKQEEYIANLLNCKRQCGSGSTPFAKGDVIADNWLFECKTTTKPKTSFSIKKDWIDKNFIERVEMGKPYSAIVYQYEEDGTNYFVLDETTFKKLYERFQDGV